MNNLQEFSRTKNDLQIVYIDLTGHNKQVSYQFAYFQALRVFEWRRKPSVNAWFFIFSYQILQAFQEHVLVTKIKSC